jgi:hypothetical protein
VQLTAIVGLSADELLGVAKASASNGPIRNRGLYQWQNIEKLPKRDQQALLRTIDAFLAKASSPLKARTPGARPDVRGASLAAKQAAQVYFSHVI